MRSERQASNHKLSTEKLGRLGHKLKTRCGSAITIKSVLVMGVRAGMLSKYFLINNHHVMLLVYAYGKLVIDELIDDIFT